MMLADATIGAVLGDFELQQKIGEGGFGTVYLAEQRALGRRAVVKVMRRSLAGRPDAIERFVLEAKLASKLDHPCAAHIYAFGAEADGTLWIAMELVKGTSLDALIASSGPLPIDRVVPMMERLCEAVQLAHEQGIVHRDIKPANVMVASQSGRLMPKLLDFGIAKQLVSTDVGDVAAVLVTRSTMSPFALAAEPVSGLDRTLQPDVSQTASTRPALTNSAASLTQAGQILGSPPYMAPEQWVDPNSVGPWTDQYALALLAYEALTGARACNGASLAALAEQHLDLPLPRSDRLSDAIYAVLARAAAKDPQERFTNAEGFAVALRAASGWSVDADVQLAQLRADVRTAWTEDAPQPIAETVSVLVATRSPQRIVEQVVIVARVIARWLGVIAIACRSKHGRVDAHSITDALRELRRRAPRDEDWLDLAVALTRPAAQQPETWPLPELATWCAEAGAVAALRRLVTGDASIVDGDLGDRARATRDLAALEHVLEALSWLLDYEVGREVPGGIELWVGARAGDRIVRRGPSEAHRVVLLDADGGRAVLLSPLVMIAAPMTGEVEEMFLFSGPSRTGAALFCTFPRGYERDELAIWSWLAEHLFEAGAGPEHAASDGRSPYPGLAAFTADDARSFVGREREVGELVNRLRAQPIVAVVGPSGAGKSSFLAAGVVPALPLTWHTVIIRPGADPIGTLSATCEHVETTPYRDGARVDPDPAVDLGTQLIARAERERGMFVLVVDQAEELFTQGTDESARTAFAEAVRRLATSPHARVVLGVRDDFLCRLDELVPWRGVVTRHVQILATPDREALERIVIEPAKRRGYDLEDPALASRMIDEVVDRVSALPLLSFAAAELWERRDRHFKRITTQAYQQIGGVAGALVQHADGVVDGMAVVDRRLVRLAFRRLLTAEGARIVHGRAELVAALGGGAAAESIVERLLAARLIVSHDHDAGERVEIIHEALTRTWPRLEAWRQEDASGAKLHEQLVGAARYWQERDQPDGLLWQGETLDELRRWRRGDAPGLTPIEEAFVQGSERLARRSRRRKFVVVSTAIAVLSCTVAVLAVASHRISAQRADAVRRVAAGFEERGRLAAISGENTRALLYLAEAARLGEGGDMHDLLVAAAAASVDSLDRIVLHDPEPIESAYWSDRAIVTVHDGVTRLWDRRTGRAHATLSATGGFPVGGDMISLSGDGSVVFTTATGEQRWRVDHAHEAFANLSGATARGNLLVTYAGPTARLWTSEGVSRGELRHDAPISSGVFDRGGKQVATVSGGELKIWDADTTKLIATCKTPSRRLFMPTFTPAGDRIVFGSLEGTVRICNTASGELEHTMVGHLNITHSIGIDEAATFVASASYDGTVRLWNLATGEALAVLAANRGPLRAVAISPDGHRVASGADDGTIRIWDVESATQLASLDGHGTRISALRWDVADHLESASFDGSVRQWNVARAMRHAITHGHEGGINRLDVSPDGLRLLTQARDNTSRVWNAKSLEGHDAITGQHDVLSAALVAPTHLVAAGGDGQLVIDQTRVDTPDIVMRVASSSDGARIATASNRGTVRLLDPQGHATGSVEVGFAPDQLVFGTRGRWLFAVPETETRAGVVVIDPQTGVEIARLAKGMTISEIAVGDHSVAIATERDVIVFALGTWTQSAKLAHRSWLTAVALAPDGRVITACNDSTVTVWSARGETVASLAGSGRGSSLDVSRDATLLAVGTSDGAIDIWDLASYRMMVTVDGHRMATYAVKFSPDGARVYSSGQDGRVASWDVSHDPWSRADLERLIKCRVPLRLEGEAILPRTIDFDDPSCR